jgi:hypothetical protein
MMRSMKCLLLLCLLAAGTMMWAEDDPYVVGYTTLDFDRKPCEAYGPSTQHR